KVETFETAPIGNFSVLQLSDMAVTLSGTASDVNAGITDVIDDQSTILGYNTTSGGSKHLRIVPPFGTGVITATFTPTVRLQAWGAYFTGIETFPSTSVKLTFDDGTSQTFDILGNAGGGVTFFGFTDPGKF